MRHQLSYRDAVFLLAGEDTKLVERIDRALGGAILAASVVVGPGAFAFLGVKNAAIEAARGFLSHLAVRMRGLTVPARGDRINAASAVIVVTAFMTAARDTIGKKRWSELGIRPEELIPAETTSKTTRDSFLTALVKTNLPTIDPHKGYDELEANLVAYYQRVAERFVHFIGGLVLWEHLNETEQSRLTRIITNELPALAAQEYKVQLLQLAKEVPELAIWLNLQEHVATRQAFQKGITKADQTIRAAIAASEDIRTTLDGVYLLLSTITSGMPAPSARWRRSLAAANAHELERPLLDVKSEQVAGVIAPSPEGGYINPDFRVAEATRAMQASVERWWESRTRRSDLQSFLASYLTSPLALSNPLLILGHPGAGKSVLTRVLAAKLPADGFAPVRVTLRDVAANSSIISQIEQAFHNIIHENVSWPEFVECLDGALPVVILDGFDELLQATGISQSDYLEKVRQFQDSEQSQGRPVVVLVTSRTAVAHRARIPEGALIIKLEPFDTDQIVLWIDNWNNVNSANFLERRVRPLAQEVVMRHYELACQPILLLMLAIYDADANGLAPDSEPMLRVSLYERLLVTFVERELLKDSAALTSEVLQEQVEMELYQLSIAAFGMFNRGAQIISVDELDRDFTGLNLVRAQADTSREFYAELTSAQRALGRFFFIHRSEARDDIESHANIEAHTRKKSLGETFEFLHATFGEYLVARCSLKIIVQAAAALDAVSPWHSHQQVADESLLAALLSFQAFSKRAQIVTFVAEIAATLPVEIRRKGLATCRVLLGRANWPSDDLSYRNYLPSEQDTVARCAAYTVNLVLIGAAFVERVGIDQIAPTRPSSATDWWRGSALVWQGRLDREAWKGLTRIIRFAIDHESGRLSICLRPESETELIASGLHLNLESFAAAMLPEGDPKKTTLGSVRDILVDERRSHELLLDELGLVNIDLVRYLCAKFGAAAEIVAVGRGYGFESTKSSIGLGSMASGLSLVLGLIFDHFGDQKDSNDFRVAFSIAVALIRSSSGGDQGDESDLRTVRWLVAVAHSKVEVLDRVEILGLLEAGLRVGGWRGDFFYYLELLKLWLRCVVTSRERSALDSDQENQFNEVATSIFALLDPNHAVGAHGLAMLEIILAIEEAGIQIEMLSPEFGNLSDWLLRYDIAALSHGYPDFAVQVVQAALDRKAMIWLVEAGLVNLSDFSDRAFAMLPQGYVDDLRGIFESRSADLSSSWQKFLQRLNREVDDSDLGDKSDHF